MTSRGHPPTHAPPREAVTGNEFGGRSAKHSQAHRCGRDGLGALAVLTSIHVTLIDVGADVVLVALLLTFAHAAFRFIDDG